MQGGPRSGWPHRLADSGRNVIALQIDRIDRVGLVIRSAAGLEGIGAIHVASCLGRVIPVSSPRRAAMYSRSAGSEAQETRSKSPARQPLTHPIVDTNVRSILRGVSTT